MFYERCDSLNFVETLQLSSYEFLCLGSLMLLQVGHGDWVLDGADMILFTAPFWRNVYPVYKHLKPQFAQSVHPQEDSWTQVWEFQELFSISRLAAVIVPKVSFLN